MRNECSILYSLTIEISGGDMRMNLPLLCTIGLTLNMAAWAGNATGGGGGDNLTLEDGAAWFYSSAKTISVCTETAAQFGLSAEKTTAEVEKALNTWKEYIQRKKVFSHLDPKVQLTTSFHIESKCNGKEDLKIYFGISNQEVEEAKKKYLQPTAFAQRTSFDHSSMWGRGFIWIANTKSVQLEPFVAGFPDWEKPNNLLAILLHEVGHVYGCGHSYNTIMTSEISDLLNWGDLFQDLKGRIDHSRELNMCGWCDFDWKSSLSLKNKSAVWKFVKEIIGREPLESTTVRLLGRPQSPIVTLEFSDELGTSQVKAMAPDMSVAMNDVPVFKNAFGIQLRNFSAVSYGSVMGKPNALLVLEYNMSKQIGEAPIRLVALTDGMRVELAAFSSK